MTPRNIRWSGTDPSPEAAAAIAEIHKSVRVLSVEVHRADFLIVNTHEDRPMRLTVTVPSGVPMASVREWICTVDENLVAAAIRWWYV